MTRTSVEILPPASAAGTSRTTGAAAPDAGNIELRALSAEGEEQSTSGAAQHEPAISYPELSRLKTSVVIATASSMVLMNSVLTGILTVALPVIAADINLQESLLLWPASVYGLTCGCTLLLSGSMADLVGSRTIYLLGCGILCAFTLGCGLAQTGIQLIAFRAISGIAMSLCLPSAVSIITTTFATGNRRNIAFACLGAAQPVGFSLGIVLGGVLASGVGWRYGYFIITGINLALLAVAVFQIPPDPRKTEPLTLRRLCTEIDWLGTLLISTSLALFSYTLSTMTVSIREIIQPANLTLLILSVILFVGFNFWIQYRERNGKVAMIPPSLFKTDSSGSTSMAASSSAAPRIRNFSTICIAVFFTWATFNAYQYFTTLYFQRIQHLTALGASVRFIPMVLSGAITNIGTGFLVPRVPADALCVGAAVLSACAPLLMAVADPKVSYWANAFVATCLIPVSADTLFTVSNLVITATFPRKTQGLAGGVFNTISQVGMSVGLGINAVISAGAAGGNEQQADQMSIARMLDGYRATYWTSFGISTVIVLISWWGLRRIGKIGVKTD